MDAMASLAQLVPERKDNLHTNQDLTKDTTLSNCALAIFRECEIQPFEFFLPFSALKIDIPMLSYIQSSNRGDKHEKTARFSLHDYKKQRSYH